MTGMLEIKDLHAGYGNMKILSGVSMKIGKGEIVSLIGANGAGKTTLCRAISRLIPITDGEIVYMGENVERLTPGGVVARKIIQVPEGRMLFEGMSVRDNLLCGAYKKSSRELIKRKLEHVFSLFPDLKEKEKERAGNLSGGQQQMVAIARGLMADPELLILDEPSIGLSPLLTKTVFNIVKKINEMGVSILIAEQNTAQVLKIATRGYVLERGQIILEGAAKDLMNNETVKKAYLGM